MTEVSMSDYDYVFKVIMIGSANVGKTTLLKRYADPTSPLETRATLGMEFKVLTFQLAELAKCSKLQVWDTSGQERFHSLAPVFFRGAAGVILVFSLDDRDSFETLGRTWMQEVEQYATCPFMVLVGNKCDLPENQWAVSAEEAERFAAQHSLRYIQTSAVTLANVEELFYDFALELTRRPLLHANKEKKAAKTRDPNDVELDYYALKREIRKENTCNC